MNFFRALRYSNDRELVPVDERPRRDRSRLLIFLIVFFIGCASGLGYTYLRPAVYETSASVLIIPAAVAFTASNGQAEPQTVGLERHALLATPLLSELLVRLPETGVAGAGAPRTLADLQRMLSVQKFEETNIVRLSARGPSPAVLSAVVNLWIDLYLESQAKFQRTLIDDVDERLGQQARELQSRILRKRTDINRFRLQHDIISMQRDENRILARLKGLTNSFNNAKDEELTARSNLSAMRAAIRQGKPVVSLLDERRIGSLEQLAVRILAQLTEFEQKFTPEYMAYDPKIKRLVRQLEVLEQKISELRAEAEDTAIAEAERRLASARQSVRALEGEFDQSKGEVAAFTARFAEHETLKDELAQMELVYREIKTRQMQRETDRQRVTTRVDVLERAFEPIEPVWPNYTRDAAISVTGSIFLGLLAALFYDFFNRPSRLAVAPRGSQALYGIVRAPVTLHAEAQEVAAAPVAPPLEHHRPRELDDSEARALLEAADRATRPLAGMFLSGLTVEEAVALCRADVDLDAGVAHIPGASARVLPLSDFLKSGLARLLSEDMEAEAPIWRGQDGNPLEPEDLNALIACAAHDAGLTEAAQISAETLRHSYIIFLVRQGARLSDLEYVAGHLPPSTRAAYAHYSPPGSGVTLDRVVIVHPALDPLRSG